jgi:hypothetical protein
MILGDVRHDAAEIYASWASLVSAGGTSLPAITPRITDQIQGQV